MTSGKPDNPYARTAGAGAWLDGHEAGRASRDAEIEAVRTDLADSRRSHAEQIDQLCRDHIQVLQEELDEGARLRAQLAENEAECERLLAALRSIACDPWAGNSCCLLLVGRAQQALAPASKGEGDG